MKLTLGNNELKQMYILHQTERENFKTHVQGWVGKRSSDILFETGSNECFGKYGLYHRSTITILFR